MPTIPFGLPPWVGTPANPAQVYAEGLQIGARIGSQQAAQMFQQQQLAQQQQRMAMEQQQQEVENQRNAQLLNLKVAETARKHQASQEFRARIGAGEDPARVLMELGPELGESPADVLNAQRMREQSKSLSDIRLANLNRLVQSDQARQDIAERNLTLRKETAAASQKAAAERETRLKANARSLALARMAKDEELQNLIQDVKVARDAVAEIENESGLFTRESKKQERLRKARANLKEAEAALEHHRRALMSEMNLSQEEAIPTEMGGDSEEVMDNTALDEGVPSPVQAMAPSAGVQPMQIGRFRIVTR